MKITLLLLAITSYVAAQTVSSVPNSAQCGSDSYTSDEIIAAVQSGLNGDGGSSDYPHQYEDYEGFTFSTCNSPYYEYPILSDGTVYTGGSPGADRVVYGSVASDYSSAAYCFTLTHTGASGNDFVECQES